MSESPKPKRVGEAWCSQHNSHPLDCFNKHYAQSNEKMLTEYEHRQQIIKEHIRKQEENIRKQAERLSRDPDKLREKYKKTS